MTILSKNFDAGSTFYTKNPPTAGIIFYYSAGTMLSLEPVFALVSSAVMQPSREPRPMEPKKMPKNLPMVRKKASASKESALAEQ